MKGANEMVKLQPPAGAEAASMTIGTTCIRGESDYVGHDQKPRSLSADLAGHSGRGAVQNGGREGGLLNPWRELDHNAFVIAYSMRGTARCSSCSHKIAKGDLQLGTFYTHEDQFTLVRWHHQRCVVAPECLTDPMDLCGIEDLKGDDLDRVLKWLGFGSPSLGSVKDRSWTA